MKESDKERVREVLNSLTQPRLIKIITMRFGIDDGRSKTQKVIAKQFQVTGGRIRQLETKGLRHLRHPTRSRKLWGIPSPDGEVKDWPPEAKLLLAIFGSPPWPKNN